MDFPQNAAMNAADAHAVHPLDVLVQAVAGDIAIHPVPPHTGTRLLGRILKSVSQIVSHQRTGDG